MAIPQSPLIILAGDVGGTKANLAAFEFHHDATDHPLRMLRNTRYPSAHFKSLDEIVVQFLSEGPEKIASACFGVPGPVSKNAATPTNLGWQIHGDEIAKQTGIPCVRLLNDLAANAFGISELEPTDFVQLQHGLEGAVGNRCVVSPGTGLGEAGLYWDGHRHRVWATEGGHTDFAPRSAIEVKMLEYLQSKFGHVSNERVVSGLGLANIYGFLRDTGFAKENPEAIESMKTESPGEVITRFAEHGTCQICMQTLEIFCNCLAMEAGNFALKSMATGGVYLGGGIPAKILWKLKSPAFIEAFNAKGRLESLMESMPVSVVLNDQAALLGAARFAVDALDE